MITVAAAGSQLRGLGKHRKDAHGQPLGDNRCTPVEIWQVALQAIGRDAFDLDAASNPAATVPALDAYMGPVDGRDGLALPWQGDVWLNFPFSNPRPWIERVQQEAWRFRSITVLGPNDSSTRWWQDLQRFVDVRAAWPRRVHFPLAGVPKGGPPAAIALFYSGPQSNAWARVMLRAGCTVDAGSLQGDRPLVLCKPRKTPRLALIK